MWAAAMILQARPYAPRLLLLQEFRSVDDVGGLAEEPNIKEKQQLVVAVCKH